MVSTIMFNDMTRIQIDAGTACLTSKLEIDAVPKEAELFAIVFPRNGVVLV
jgi:hypothetical protein